MLINFVHIKNFRKLKDCRIEFSDNQTLFVGANNSGKTTAMDALILFLKLKNKFTSRDFTLSNWNAINKIGELWDHAQTAEEVDLGIQPWVDSLPALDVWLDVAKHELHYVHHLIPKLDWTGGLLGIRLRFEPASMEALHTEFLATYRNSRSIVGKAKDNFKIWPASLWDFLDQKSNLNSYFKVQTYLLDPSHKDQPQVLKDTDLPVDGDAFAGLIKIDIINAQRGFSDVNSESSEPSNVRNLSSQLRSYYDKHLNPSVNPSENDIAALQAIDEAKKLFNRDLQGSFSVALDELAGLNYPGFGNPTIFLSSDFNTLDGLNHDSAVQYALAEGLSLPEKYNGLGYQNLISIIFKLIRFRDEWMQVGKNYNDKKQQKDQEFEPLHLVLIEEPEAHLHAQVQQVFIKKAYDVLRKHKDLGDDKFRTQLIISTHSSHIAHEASFKSLRYFKRGENLTEKIATSIVVNLSKIFGTENDTTRFARRYLKTTHCDLFFADAVIIVEGPAERMLIPYFIKHHSNLGNAYISILEIGGSHAHKLRPLIESLGIVCLIITDIDSVQGRSKVQPTLKQMFTTGNDTIKTWLPAESDLDKLIALSPNDRQSKVFPICVAHQLPISIGQKTAAVTVVPYTFEDALVLTNLTIFSRIGKATGLLKKMVDASKQTNIQNAAKAMYDAITADGAKKAEFALELFYFEEPSVLTVPKYIEDGLVWLEGKLMITKSTSGGAL